MFDSLYIHVPFCRSKCAYCAFYSLPGSERATRLAYLQRLREEMFCHSGMGSDIRTIFVGGGTPTSLDTDELEDMLGTIGESVAANTCGEFTVECNPETLDRAKTEVLAAAGVGRISIGVQSFLPRLRNVLGRHGEVAAISRARRLLANCGIGNVGIDLIYGIPGQSLDDWCDDIRMACELGISHLSTYALTIEEGSRLARTITTIPDDDRVTDMWEATDEILSGYGLVRYEVSNFARKGFECQHNLGIWHGAKYLGCGPGASSFDGKLRWTNPGNLEAWLEGAEPELDPLPGRQRACELLAFGLRTVPGWDLVHFRERTGYDARDIRGAEIKRLEEQGLLDCDDRTLRPTRRGLLFHDTVATELL